MPQQRRVGQLPLTEVEAKARERAELVLDKVAPGDQTQDRAAMLAVVGDEELFALVLRDLPADVEGGLAGEELVPEADREMTGGVLVDLRREALEGL